MQIQAAMDDALLQRYGTAFKKEADRSKFESDKEVILGLLQSLRETATAAGDKV